MTLTPPEKDRKNKKQFHEESHKNEAYRRCLKTQTPTPLDQTRQKKISEMNLDNNYH